MPLLIAASIATTQAAPIITPNATTSFNFAPAANATTLVSVALFSGLTLSAGTYYLTLASTDPTVTQGINVGSAMTFITAPGVTVGPAQFISAGLNGGFPPASTGALRGATLGNRFFTITGDPAASEIPEPSTVLLISAGLLATVTLRRKSR